MIWEEIKALPDKEFMKAMIDVEFNYCYKPGSKSRRYKFSNLCAASSGWFCDLLSYYSGKWHMETDIYLRDYDPAIPSLPSGIYMDSSVASIPGQEPINRDLIHILPNQKGAAA